MRAGERGDEGLRQGNVASAPGPVEVEDGDGNLTHSGGRFYGFGTTESHGPFEAVDARDRVIRRKVTLRKLSVTSPDEADARRFARAARLQAQLEHPVIVPVYDIERDATGANTMVLPAVRGVSLRRVLDGLTARDPAMTGKFTRTALLQAFLQLCLAVEYAHVKGVVHRNIEPSGVALGDHGEVYLVDWSLAKTLKGSHAQTPDAGVGATLPGQALGTPGYASPEQLTGADADARSDVYSLGALLFEMLAGSPLHTGATLVERVQSTQLGVNACPSQRAPDAGVSEAFDTVCVRATATDPKLRYPSARALHDAVETTLAAALEVGRRAELAARHAELAESFAMRALSASSGEYELRAKALREAGRAFALDPESPGARRAMLALLKEEPLELPPEANAEREAEEAEQARAVGRFAMVAYGGFVGLLGLVVFSGIRSWLGFSLVVGTMLATVGFAFVMSRAERPTVVVPLLMAATSFLAVASSSGLYGPLILVPSLAVANTLCMSIGFYRRYRGWILGAGLCSIVLPFVFERLGVLPQSYVLRAQSITVLPVIREFPEGHIRFGVLLASLAAVIVPTLFTWRLSDASADARKRMHTYGWQLRRLLPNNAYAGLTAPAALKAGGKRS